MQKHASVFFALLRAGSGRPNRTSVFPRLLAALLLAGLCRTVEAQEQLGMRLERYSGLYGIGINPANAAFTPNRWEISLFSADGFVENSYAFLQNTSLPRVVSGADRIELADHFSPERPAPPGVVLADFFQQKRRMHGIGQGRLGGPGALWQAGDRQRFGVTTAMRSLVSAYRIPRALGYDNLQALPDSQAVRVPAFGAAAMAWGELGAYYGRRGETAGGLATAFGISPKLLFGFEGGYARARNAFTYTSLPGSAAFFADDVSWDYALTTGQNNGLRLNGLGLGLDLGFSWASPAAGDGEEYDWRAGVSVIDLGFVRFGQNAERHWLRLDTSALVSETDLPGQDALDGYLPDLSAAFLGDSARTYQDDHFSIGLPTALSLQFDYRLASGWYVHALLVQPAPVWRHSLRRPATLAVTPRFEQRWLSVSLPLVLDDWRSPRFGLAARLGALYLGTDNLPGFFRKRQWTGGDFYIALKINAFEWGDQGSGRQNLRKIKCFRF